MGSFKGLKGNEKGCMKKKFWNLVDNILAWIVGGAGVLLSVYCVLLQTELFKYVAAVWCFVALALGAGIGYSLLAYFKGLSEKSHELRPITSADFKNTLRGSVFLFGVAALLGFTSTEIIWFLVGAGGLMFTGVFILGFKLWEIREKRDEKNEEEGA